MHVAAWRPERLPLLGGAILAAAAVAVYSRTFSVPMLFDDIDAIVNNPTIRHWSTAFWPPNNTGASGRPILNLSLAINYAISGTAAWSYHALNLAIHVLAGLALFGIVRQALRPRSGQALARRAGAEASLIGFGAALLWTLHPLQTESVTCIIQRTESLVGLFYLFTLYCFIRAVGADVSGPLAGRAPNECYPRSWWNQGHLQSFGDSGGLPNTARASHAASPATGRCVSRVWFTLSIATCLLGMATKEVMVSAPLMVLLYDRTFVAGSFREAWQRRRAFYVGLGCTWLLLAALMVGSQKRGGTVGFGLGVSSWDYALTQCRAIVLYLRLSVWPHPLVVDYGTAVVRSALDVWPQALLLVALVAGTIHSLWRRPALGFAGAWFFAILAPSSSVVPLATQTIAEHRMYLPLAAVIVAGVAGLHNLLRTLRDHGQRDHGPRDNGPQDHGPRDHGQRDHGPRDNGQQDYGLVALGSCGPVVRSPVVLMVLLLALALGLLTARRNEDYRSELAIWSDTVAKQPDNERAHFNLGVICAEIPGRLNDAITQYNAALHLQPNYAEAHFNLGVAWSEIPGHLNDAIAQFEAALRLQPDYAGAHNNLGGALAKIPGRLDEAIAQYKEALRLKPDYAEAHNNLGGALAKIPGRLDEAIAHYETALRLKPDYAEARTNLGVAFAQVPGRLNDAIAQFKEAVLLKPDRAESHIDLGNAWLQMPGRLNDAVAEYREALRLQPDSAEAHNNLGLALSQMPGWLKDAIAQFEEAVRLKPDYAQGWHDLGVSRFQSGDLRAAAAAFREEVRLLPDDPLARQALAAVLQQAGDH